MIDDRSFERLTASWIAEGPTDAPEATVRAALNEIARTSQDRVGPWSVRWLDRPDGRRSGARIALAAAATIAAVAILASLAVIGGRPAPVVTPAPALPSPAGPSQVPPATVAPSPTLTTPAPSPSESTGPPLALPSSFTSERYGYTVGIGSDWTVRPATLTWSGPDNSGPVLDEIAVTGTDSSISGSSEALLPGQTFEAWLDLFQSPTNAANPCFGGPASTWPTVQIGAVSWRWEHTCGADVALTERDGRAYVLNAEYQFGSTNNITPAQFRQVLATVAFDAASVPAPSPAPPLDQAFASARNGYSLRYPSGWSAAQATAPAPGDFRPAPDDPSWDVLGDATARLTVTSLPLGPGQTAVDWIQSYCSFSRTKWSPSCAAAPASWPTIAVGSDSGWLTTDGDGAGAFPEPDSRVYQAMAIKDGRAYEIRLEGAVGPELIRAILASMQLDPTAAEEPTPAP